MNKKILFRVDAHKEIALGHLKRCISLGRALEQIGIKPVYATAADDAAINLLNNEVIEYIILSTRVAKGNDIENTLCAASKLNIQKIIIDSYDVNNNYFRLLRKKGIEVAYIDDLGKTDLPCDLIVNGIHSSCNLNYTAKQSLKGIEYLILAKEYWSPPQKKIGKVDSILVTMGGIDHYDISSKIIDLCEEIAGDFELKIIVGPYYDNVLKIKRAQNNAKRNIELVYNPPSLFSTMSKCDMAISAGGFTLYELSTIGLPTIGIALWPHQEINVDFLSDKGLICPLYFKNGSTFSKDLSYSIDGLLKNMDHRIHMSQKGQSLFDGMGAVRAAQKILNWIDNKEEGRNE